MKQLIAISFLLAIFFGCKKKEESTKPIQEKITESVYASGIIKSKNQYQVFSAVNGIVKDILLQREISLKKETHFINCPMLLLL